MYITIAVKLTVGFFCLLLFLNLSGRAQLAPNSALDQIGNYVLGGIIGGVIYNPQVSVLEMVLVMAIWAALILSMRVLRTRNREAKKLIDGRSLLLYDKGQLLTQNLALAGKTARDFIAGMHIRGFHRLADLQSVWLETNGQYTVLKQGETPFQLSIIEDGQLVTESLQGLGQDAQWVEGMLRGAGVEDIAHVAYAEWYADEGSDTPSLHIYRYQ